MSASHQTATFPGRAVSPWLDGAIGIEHPRLERDTEVDVAVIGAGIVGLTTALLLARGGVRTAVLEARSVGAGVSGNTTAKLSSLHGLSYDAIRSAHGGEVARVYAQANEWGIEQVWAVASELEIDCDLRRKQNLTYTEDRNRLAAIEAEVAAATAAGLPASLTTRTGLPFEVAGAVSVPDQAEFHPVKYLRAIAAWLERDGTPVYEATRALAVADGSVRTEGGPQVRAERVIVATQLPFLDRGLFFARAHVQRSYALTARLAGGLPPAMYLQAESPGRSLRAMPWADQELLIIGGESHDLGQGEPVERFRALERYARERFDVVGFEHRWSAHDFISEDGLPFIGRLWPLSDRVLIATGFRKWGLAMGTAAARILADALLGRDNDWAASFDPRRVPGLSGAARLLKHNADSGVHFVADRIKRHGGAGGLAPGEGRVVGDGLAQKAVHRDAEGRLHAVSARCTHLGCIVRWNAAEQTWDCPCHGSRFGAGGEVANGPATKPLQPARPPGDD